MRAAVAGVKAKRSDDIVAFRARADLRTDSRAVTGLVQPCSSEDISAIEPAPVRASGPVHTKCCIEGVEGARLKDKSRFSGLTSAGVALGAPARFSRKGKATGAGAVNKLRGLRVCASASVLGKKL